MVCFNLGISPNNYEYADTNSNSTTTSTSSSKNNDVNAEMSDAITGRSRRQSAKKTERTPQQGISLRDLESLMNNPDFQADQQKVNRGEMSIEAFNKKYHIGG